MRREAWPQRLRILLIAGVCVPLAMILLGALVGSIGSGPGVYVARLPSAVALGVGVVVAGLSTGLVALLSKLHPAIDRALRDTGAQVGLDAMRMAGYPVMLVVVIAAGVGEEALFRGGLQPLVGAIPAALLFGFSHGGWRREMWAYVLAASAAGLLFGLAYELTGTLWTPMVAHAGHNVSSTLYMLWKAKSEPHEVHGNDTQGNNAQDMDTSEGAL